MEGFPRIAGNGSAIHCGDGGFATFSCLNKPFGVAVDKYGNTFISEQGNSRIRRVDRNGMITTVAGNGTFLEYCGDGGKATMACLNRPSGLTVDLDGNLVFADQENNRIRRVNADGIISTVAGKGRCDFGGDGGPAIEACLNRPTDVKMDNKGNLFIADLGHSRIRKVDPNGIITTVAGNGIFEFCGDNGPAVEACLGDVVGIAIDSIGNLYLADLRHPRIRKVDTNGIITTVAGKGTGGFCGDGGPATEACFQRLSGIAVDNSGNIFIADPSNHRVRMVNERGIITTIAGTGESRIFCGDSGDPTRACLSFPELLAFDPSGRLYIADNLHNRIRRVTFNVPRISFADINSDGHVDLGWRNLKTGATAMWHMNESGLREFTSSPDGAPLNWMIRGSWRCDRRRSCGYSMAGYKHRGDRVCGI